jgi:hypothetical protein
VKKLFFIVILIVLPSALFASDATTERPHWSLEMKGGHFVPDIDNWSTFYGSRDTGEYGGALAYKILRQVEAGIEGTYISDRGQGFAPVHNTTMGYVKYGSVPLNVFILARGVFSEQQWLVPYAGGGWTRMFYREEIVDQGVVRGHVNGSHARGGIQLLLDGLDPHAANNMRRDYGIYHTYLFFEARYTRAMVDTVATSSTPSKSINLGGKSLLGGFLFEF